MGDKETRKFLRAIETFRRLDLTMPSQAIAAFLFIASRRDCTVKDVEKFLGLGSSATSRNMKILRDEEYTDRNNTKSGLGLITTEFDAHDARRKLPKLTQKGEKLLADLEDIILS